MLPTYIVSYMSSTYPLALPPTCLLHTHLYCLLHVSYTPTYTVPHTDDQMFLHLLSPQTEPAWSPRYRGPFSWRGTSPTPITLLLSPLLTSSHCSLVKEKLLP